MDPVTLYQLLAARPFRPVRVCLRDGRTYDIRFRELAVVGATWLDIGLLAPGEAQPIYDSVVTVLLAQIDRVEHSSATAAAVAP
jgi:hypothetical protein